MKLIESLSMVTTGKGIYTQRKRHAYKIIPTDENNGKYGKLIIDLPVGIIGRIHIAGYNGVKNEFSEIAHALNRLKVNELFDELLKIYLVGASPPHPHN